MRPGHSCLSMALLFAAACSTTSGGPTPDQVPSVVLKSAPTGWVIAEDTSGQVPEGHYWGDQGRDYQGPRGRRLVLMGPRDVEFNWRDRTGAWQHEKLSKETLELWIMPSSYRESWASWFNVHKPPPAEMIFSGDSVKVYAKPSIRVVSEARLKELLKDATETRGVDSSDLALSWSTWRPDLQRELAAGGEGVGR
jgi:hypothetical protein